MQCMPGVGTWLPLRTHIRKRFNRNMKRYAKVILLQVCAKCKKTNLPTRKFCIGCGSSLLVHAIKRKKERSMLAPKRWNAAAEKYYSVIEASYSGFKTADSHAIESQDEIVRPSQIVRDRIRTTKYTRVESELEKARRAFARADAVGINEEKAGIVETRMVRASEIPELMRTARERERTPIRETPDMDAMRTRELVSRKTMTGETVTPVREAAEKKMLGALSTYVTPDRTDSPSSPALKENTVSSTEDQTGRFASFSSSRYEVAPSESMPEHQTDSPPAVEVPLVWELAPEMLPKGRATAATPQPKSVSAPEGSTFEYPRAVYKAMGAARLEQARRLVATGRKEEAQRAAYISRTFFELARDDAGVTQVDRLKGIRSDR